MIQIIDERHRFQGSRAIQIESIIEKRQPLGDRLDIVQNNLNNLSKLLKAVESKRKGLLDKTNDATAYKKLEEINFSKDIEDISRELDTLEKLKSRFCRRTLNIGVVGRARQGKSRLLQSLTGLSQAEIPDGDDQHCTGVRSNIHHVLGKNTEAGVYFHSEYSFINEVLAPYYHQLNLGSVPQSIELFANSPLPELNSGSSALDKAKYQHLIEYHRNVEKYRRFFQQNSPLRISKEQIREYVAQDTIEGDRIYHNYLAVKKVDIFCSFPNQDIGKIALVDMPGLGDTGIGDVERLLKTLGQDIDLVLFVRMPKATGDDWLEQDVELYDLANGVLTDLSIKEWSFMILNHVVKSDNYKRCLSLEKNIAKKHIDVTETIICDCANAAETQTEILDRVIDYLTQRIDVLDSKYASACQQRLLQIQQQVESKLQQANTVLGNPGNDEWQRSCVLSFSQFWNKLREELERLTRSMIQDRDTENERFKSAVDDAIEHCRNHPGIPSINQILDKRDRHASFESAYAECLHEVRTRLSQRFLNLDIALKDSLEQAKYQVVKVLKANKLEDLATGEGRDYLFTFIEKIPEDLEHLRLGFNTLATFDLQYRGLIQHRIRKHLDVLTPDRTKYKFNDLFSNFFGQPDSNQEKVKKIHNNLRQAQIEAVNNCERELKNLLIEPNQAGFAIVEEFVDRVLRAEGIREEWQIFVQDYATIIWQDKFESINANSQIKREWVASVQQAKDKNKLENFKFI